MKLALGTTDEGTVSMDLESLMQYGLLIQGRSGSGKTSALRRILEQTHGKVQQIVLDPEGEFYTLREHYDYIIAGKGGDCAADPRSAKLLARKILELNVSAVCDLYELKAHDRVKFVRYFAEALIEAPRSLRRPLLIAIDEAHLFAPEGGKSESTDAVVDLRARGRKRGISPLFATQRIASLAKGCVDMGNKLIGATGLDIDLDRARKELGFAAQRMTEIRDLQRGEFFAYGPALTRGVTKIMVGDTVTKNPALAAALQPPAAPTPKMRTVLEKLTDLPAQAEAEVKDNAALRKEVADVRRLLTLADMRYAELEKRAPEPCTHVEDMAVMAQTIDKQRELLVKTGVILADSLGWIDSVQSKMRGVLTALEEASATPMMARAIAPVIEAKDLPSTRTIRPAGRTTSTSDHPLVRTQLDAAKVSARMMSNGHRPELNGPEQRVLNAMAWWEAIGVPRPVKSNVGFIAGYRVGKKVGGNFANVLGALHRQELIAYPLTGRVELTPMGRAAAEPPAAMPTQEALHEAIYARLDGPERRVLEVLIEAYPDVMSKQELGERAGYTVGPKVGGNFANILGRLRGLGLIDYPNRGETVATELLFPG